MRNSEETYNIRNEEKKYLQKKVLKKVYINEREVWYVKLGVNIGFEQDGKSKFRRPVLVIKKIGNLYLVLPMTTKLHHVIGKNKYFYHLLATTKRISSSLLILSQLRMIDKRRFMKHMDVISKEEFMLVKQKIRDICL